MMEVEMKVEVGSIHVVKRDPGILFFEEEAGFQNEDVDDLKEEERRVGVDPDLPPPSEEGGDGQSEQQILEDPLGFSSEPMFSELEYQDEMEEIKGTTSTDDVKPVIIDVKMKALKTNSLSRSTTQRNLSSSKGQKLKTLKPAICVYCHTGFPTADLYERHMSTEHKDERPFACRHCGKRFSGQQNCHRHETIHNPKRWEGEPQWECDLCPKRYHLKQSMETHRKKVHLGYKPPKRPNSRPLLEHHSTKGVKNPNPFRKPKQVHQCPDCDRQFDMRCNLQKHMIVHTRERPFSCPICQQCFARATLVKTHIRRKHEESTPSGIRHMGRPKFQNGQPCPCTVCGKVFSVPSQLRIHMLLHTGEKPLKCPHCDARFRLNHGLRSHIKRQHTPNLSSNPLKLFKCMVCGKSDIAFFNDLQNHRKGRHFNVPYESEKEKAFACGVCGKPHFLREDAIICAALGHDPTRLRKEMFKFQCPECPPEKFGFWRLAVLRSHWEEEHTDKPLPTKYRNVDYYEKKGSKAQGHVETTLPNCSIFDQKVRQSWKRDGIPEEVMKSKTPLFIELPLLSVSEEQCVVKRKRKRKGQVVSNFVECDLCGLKLLRHNLRRHEIKVHAVPKNSGSHAAYQCGYCNKIISSKPGLIQHEKAHKNKFSTQQETLQRNLASVNIHDSAAVAAVLAYRSVRVSLYRLDE